MLSFDVPQKKVQNYIFSLFAQKAWCKPTYELTLVWNWYELPLLPGSHLANQVNQKKTSNSVSLNLQVEEVV